MVRWLSAKISWRTPTAITAGWEFLGIRIKLRTNATRPCRSVSIHDKCRLVWSCLISLLCMMWYYMILYNILIHFMSPQFPAASISLLKRPMAMAHSSLALPVIFQFGAAKETHPMWMCPRLSSLKSGWAASHSFTFCIAFGRRSFGLGKQYWQTYI